MSVTCERFRAYALSPVYAGHASNVKAGGLCVLWWMSVIMKIEQGCEEEVR